MDFLNYLHIHKSPLVDDLIGRATLNWKYPRVGTEAPGVDVTNYVPRVDQGQFLYDYKASRVSLRGWLKWYFEQMVRAYQKSIRHR